MAPHPMVSVLSRLQEEASLQILDRCPLHKSVVESLDFASRNTLFKCPQGAQGRLERSLRSKKLILISSFTRRQNQHISPFQAGHAGSIPVTRSTVFR